MTPWARGLPGGFPPATGEQNFVWRICILSSLFLFILPFLRHSLLWLFSLLRLFRFSTFFQRVLPIIYLGYVFLVKTDSFVADQLLCATSNRLIIALSSKSSLSILPTVAHEPIITSSDKLAQQVNLLYKYGVRCTPRTAPLLVCLTIACSRGQGSR